jgi:hypothetical protein
VRRAWVVKKISIDTYFDILPETVERLATHPIVGKIKKPQLSGDYSLRPFIINDVKSKLAIENWVKRQVPVTDSCR